MPREPRIDYPGATHHVFVHAVDRAVVAADAEDYERGLHLLERTCSRYEIQVHAWCYLSNHSHFVLTSRKGNLSKAMHWLGTCTAQTFNHRYGRSGHLFQARFESRLVEDDAYLLELARYVALNPVRAGLCHSPVDWKWSSYAATAGALPAPWFLDAPAFLDILGSRDRYVEWVAQGLDSTYLDERGFPVAEPVPSLESLLAQDSDRAIATAHYRYGHSQAAIARYLGVHASQICRRLAVQW